MIRDGYRPGGVTSRVQDQLRSRRARFAAAFRDDPLGEAVRGTVLLGLLAAAIALGVTLDGRRQRVAGLEADAPLLGEAATHFRWMREAWESGLIPARDVRLGAPGGVDPREHGGWPDGVAGLAARRVGLPSDELLVAFRAAALASGQLVAAGAALLPLFATRRRSAAICSALAAVAGGALFGVEDGAPLTPALAAGAGALACAFVVDWAERLSPFSALLGGMLLASALAIEPGAVPLIAPIAAGWAACAARGDAGRLDALLGAAGLAGPLAVVVAVGVVPAPLFASIALEPPRLPLDEAALRAHGWAAAAVLPGVLAVLRGARQRGDITEDGSLGRRGAGALIAIALLAPCVPADTAPRLAVAPWAALAGIGFGGVVRFRALARLVVLGSIVFGLHRAGRWDRPVLPPAPPGLEREAVVGSWQALTAALASSPPEATVLASPLGSQHVAAFAGRRAALGPLRAGSAPLGAAWSAALTAGDDALAELADRHGAAWLVLDAADGLGGDRGGLRWQPEASRRWELRWEDARLRLFARKDREPSPRRPPDHPIWDGRLFDLAAAQGDEALLALPGRIADGERWLAWLERMRPSLDSPSRELALQRALEHAPFLRAAERGLAEFYEAQARPDRAREHRARAAALDAAFTGRGSFPPWALPPL